MIVTIKALSPITHGEFNDMDVGNTRYFRRIPIIHGDKIYNTPVISGNAIRGSLRRILGQELVDSFELITKLGKNFDKFYFVVVNGGALKKSTDKVIDVERIRQIRKDIPMLSILGSACFTYMMSGMCNIGFAIPKSREFENGNISIMDMVSDVGMVKLPNTTVVKLEEASPMPFTVEALSAGVELEFNVSFAPQATEVEKACINHGFKLLKSIGGNKARGFGNVEISGIGDDELYMEWINNPDNLTNICKFVEEL